MGHPKVQTTSGNQVFHGFWDRISSKTILYGKCQSEQCGETPLKVVIIKEKRFGSEGRVIPLQRCMFGHQANRN